MSVYFTILLSLVLKVIYIRSPDLVKSIVINQFHTFPNVKVFLKSKVSNFIQLFTQQNYCTARSLKLIRKITLSGDPAYCIRNKSLHGQLYYFFSLRFSDNTFNNHTLISQKSPSNCESYNKWSGTRVFHVNAHRNHPMTPREVTVYWAAFCKHSLYV